MKYCKDFKIFCDSDKTCKECGLVKLRLSKLTFEWTHHLDDQTFIFHDIE